MWTWGYNTVQLGCVSTFSNICLAPLPLMAATKIVIKDFEKRKKKSLFTYIFVDFNLTFDETSYIYIMN
jgi:hypothetical protein